jgi:hypothetical protein
MSFFSMAKRSRFQAPRVLSDWLATTRALREIQESLDALSSRRAETAIHLRSFNLLAGSFQRASAPAAGMQARLPKASGENVGEAVILHLEGMLGPLEVWAAPGDTVNGLERATYTADGVVALWSNGVNAWSGVVQTPAESPAGEALDAEYVLGAAHTSLPNGRVATASTEISPDVSSPGAISWLLNTASVGFSKLANLTGLSVLGRAANSAGVMAAITATAARQTLRANDAGTQLEWGHPVEFRNHSNVDQGDGYSVQVVDGANTTSSISLNSGVATIAWSVDDLPASALADVAAGTFLGNITNSSGPVTANQLSILAGSGLTYGLGVMAVGAGDGIDVGASNVSVDVSDFAGTGLEDDGSNNLRIASSAAGAGLTGGSGSALAVGAGTKITVNANDVAWTGADARDNAGTLLGSTVREFQGQDSSTINELFAVVGSSLALAYEVNEAADFDWTGEHWFAGPVFFDDPTTTNIPTLGDIRGMTVEIYARSQLDLGTTAGSGDVNIQSGLSGVVDIVGGDVQLRSSGGYAAVSAGSDGVFLTGGSVYVSSGTDTPGSGGTSAGFVKFKGGSASTPSVGSGDGMHWVSPQPWGTGASVPRYTDDSNTDHECATIGPLTTIRTVGSGDVKKGTVFSLVKEIVSSGAAGAGDAAIFNASELAPFAFRILVAGYFPTTTPGAAATVTLRDSGGGGGLTLGAPMSASTPGTYANWFGGATTVDPVVAAGGTLIARCSRRDFSGVLWMLCIRT